MIKPFLHTRKIIRSPSGYTLIELLIALTIVAILAAPFLGIMLSLAKTNQKSRVLLMAGAESSNQYERLKSMTVLELAEQPVFTEIDESGLIIETRLHRYYPVTTDEDKDSNFIDIIIKENGEKTENGFLSYIASDSLQNLTSLTGVGTLYIHLDDQERGVTIHLSDDNGTNAAFHYSSSSQLRVLNIFTQQMAKNQQIHISFSNTQFGDWTINVYELPFRHEYMSFIYNEKVYQVDPVTKHLNLGNIIIQANKTEQNGYALIFLTVNVYEKLDDTIPISTRTGLIQAGY